MGWASRAALTLLAAMLGAMTLLALPDPAPSCLEGRVFDDRGAVPGARVRVQGTKICSRSDGRGRFRLSPLLAGRRATAWREGYFIGGTDSASDPSIFLKRLPSDDNSDYEWVDPSPSAAEGQNCANCHAEIYREWSSSGHARSVEGRHFRNLYEGTDWHGKPDSDWGLLTQHPDGAGVCASCHAPTTEAFGSRRIRGVASSGVHCDYCHKIESVADGQLGLSHGRFNLRLLRPKEGQVFFGSLDDATRGEDAYSPLYRDSRYCASCHEGIVFGVHVYSTYSEWQASPAARQGIQCQDCHMKPTGRMTNLAPGHGGIDRDARTLHNHRFFDGSQEEMLRRAVKATVEIERGQREVRARVCVWSEGVGHCLPTGFIDRHLILSVEGLTPDGRTVDSIEGPILPALAGEKLAGRPGRLLARVLKDMEGRTPVPFWLAAPDPPLDTRLVPGRIEEIHFVYPRHMARLRLRVWYRRFWSEVTRRKQWPNDETLVFEQVFSPPL